LPTVTSVADLRAAVAAWRGAGERVALVPTMGALHAGHLALVELAGARADRVVVSIFVNPTQFAPNEDFARYPRTLDEDLARLRGSAASLVYAPAARDMYPAGFATQIVPAGPAEGLESVARPHFFAGVATVVAKLLIQTAPDIAVFGEKDFQQLRVVERMAQDLDLPVRIIGAPIVREPDGLALSSRNIYLTADERTRAPMLHRALGEAAQAILAGVRIEAALTLARTRIGAAGFVIDYLEARNGRTLDHLRSETERPLRLLVAARLGETRLIDNEPVRSKESIAYVE
jgi:pantoate--beta-alanine ligase